MLFSEWKPRRRGAGPSFVTSLLLHTLVVGALWLQNPTPAARSFRLPTVPEILEREERKLVWYAPKTELPAVAPAQQTPVENPAERPRYQANQSIVANDPQPASERQMIRGEAPDLKLEQDLEIPNMLSWKAPRVERPRYRPTEPKLYAPPRPKPVEAEPPPEVRSEPEPVSYAQLQNLPILRYQRQQTKAQPKPAAPRTLEPEPAPEIRPEAPAPVTSPFEQTPRLRYQARNQSQPAAPGQRALEPADGPIFRDAPGAPGAAVSTFQDDLPRLRYQAGDGGRPIQTPQQRALNALGAAPEISGPVQAAGAAPVQDLPRLRYQGQATQAARQATPRQRALGELADGAAPEVGGPAPDGGVAALQPQYDLPGAPSSSLGAEGGDASGGTAGDENLVAVSLNPADKPPPAIPKGSRPGSFAAGPEADAAGGLTGPDSQQTASLRAPNLSIRGPSQASPGLRRQPDDPADALRNLTRTGGFRDFQGRPPQVEYTVDAPPIDIDRPFLGRQVFTVAINMPNITSHRGDWVIQFAEWLPPEEARARRNETPEELEERLSKGPQADVTPPWPSYKVDPKYDAEAARRKVEGEVVLYGVIRADGSLEDLQLLKGVDDRLDEAALTAIAKWRFEPARKDGRPIAVEALVRIPFRLNPDVRVRY